MFFLTSFTRYAWQCDSRYFSRLHRESFNFNKDNLDGKPASRDNLCNYDFRTLANSNSNSKSSLNKMHTVWIETQLTLSFFPYFWSFVLNSQQLESFSIFSWRSLWKFELSRVAYLTRKHLIHAKKINTGQLLE